MLHHSFAIYTAQRLCLRVEYLHFGRDRLMIGDALRIAAFHYPYDLFREMHIFLLYDFVVADDVEGHIGSNDRQAIDHFIGKELVRYQLFG